MIETPLRPRIALEDGWEFIRERVGRSWLSGHGSGGEKVALPHCWNTTDTFQYGLFSYSGWGAYRRHGTLPTSTVGNAISWRLCAGGFYGVGDVWFDGHRLARVDGQYLGTTIDLPPLRGATGHLMAFRLDNRWHRNVLPGFRQPDFILHGGLAGGVWLEGVPELHLDTDRIRIDCRKQDSGAEHVTVEWALAGDDGRRRRGHGRVEPHRCSRSSGGHRPAMARPKGCSATVDIARGRRPTMLVAG